MLVNSQQLLDSLDWYWQPSSPLLLPREPGIAYHPDAVVQPHPQVQACSQSHSHSRHPWPEVTKSPQAWKTINRASCMVCVYVHVHLRVVVVCVWQGGESCGRGKFCRYHLSPYGHPSLGSLHQSLQLVCRNVFGSDQQHHLSITQETRTKLKETDCSFILRQVSLLWRTVPCVSLRGVPYWRSASQKHISMTKWIRRKWFHSVL